MTIVGGGLSLALVLPSATFLRLFSVRKHVIALSLRSGLSPRSKHTFEAAIELLCKALSFAMSCDFGKRFSASCVSYLHH